VRAALEAAAAAHPGVRVRYADCSAGACVASVESGEAAAIDKLIEDKQRLPPGFMVRAHQTADRLQRPPVEASSSRSGTRRSV
jgi:hypothetical protein